MVLQGFLKEKLKVWDKYVDKNVIAIIPGVATTHDSDETNGYDDNVT